MHDNKLPTHIRIGRIQKVVQEIETWIYAHETVKYSNEKYSEGIVEGLKQALEIIEKNIFESRKTEG